MVVAVVDGIPPLDGKQKLNIVCKNYTSEIDKGQNKKVANEFLKRAKSKWSFSQLLRQLF